MTPAASAVDQLGERIRLVRLERGMGVRELARRIDCSPSMISQIERGSTKPSVSTLYAISTALSISTDSLITGVPDDDDVTAPSAGAPALANRRPGAPDIVLHPGERRVLNLERGVQWQLLMPVPDPSTEFMEVTYAPGGGSVAADHAIRHNGREYCVILEGVLSVQIGFESFALEPGDSMAFDSTIPHRFWNEGERTVRAVWFVLDRRPS
ncbi:MAG: cupin domain-containing protein [Actinomycetota bacterium]|nr:cupin domain-containing protein [Actinomycetota bacterium]